MRRLLCWLAALVVRGPHRPFVLGDLDEGYVERRATRGVFVAAWWFAIMTIKSAYSIRRERSESRNKRNALATTLEGIGTDLKMGWRLTRNQPAISVTAAVVMALGVGTATYAYGVHYGMFEVGLPVSHPDRMVDITSTALAGGSREEGMSFDDFLDFRASQTTMDDLALWDGFEPVNVTWPGAAPERITTVFITASLHSLLELTPVVGRTFTPDDDLPGSPLVAVLTYALWERRFGKDPEVLGRSITVDGAPATVVGVLQPLPETYFAGELYLPVRPKQASPARRATRDFYALGRLREGVTVAEANREVRMLAARLESTYPETNRGISARVAPFVEAQTAGVPARGDRLLRSTGALMLLIALANVTNLFLVRGLVRRDELRLRLALGASRWRVVRHFLGEAFLPIGLGALGGALLAARALDRYGARTLALWERFEFGAPHAWFVVQVTVAALLLVSALASVQTVQGSGSLTRTGGTRTVGSARFGRAGRALVIGEIALGGVALFVAGLMVKTAYNLQTVDYGFTIEGITTGTVQLDEARYETLESRVAFWEALRARVKSIPGVADATLATQLPMIRYRGWTAFQLDGTAPAPDVFPGANRSTVTPEFFAFFGKSLVRGRAFTEADHDGAEPVVIVNEDFVRKFLPDGPVLGRRIRLGGPGSQGRWMRIVGIAPHMWMDTDVDVNPEGMYVPLAQHAPAYASVAIRSSSTGFDHRDALRTTLMALDPALPLDDVMSMSELIHMRTSLYRRTGAQFIVLGVVALIVSMVGLYGVMAYLARTRTREMGIRLALGARHVTILGLVLRDGSTQIVAGIVCGIGLALYVSRGLSRFVFQMSPWDPWVLVLSFTAVALAGVLATLVPAKRAARVNPLVALRAE